MRKPSLLLISNTPLLLFLLIIGVFGMQSEQFLSLQNLRNVLLQTSSTGILAIGMTFVLLTAGVDLSVGAIMFVAAAIGGKYIFEGGSLWFGLLIMLSSGMVYGAINAAFIARLGMMPFVVTLATMYMGRGAGLWLTETRAMNLPESIYQLGTFSVLGIPLPVLCFVFLALAGHLILQHTPYGRQIYAVGGQAEVAQKAGLPVKRLLFSVYLIAGFCAAIAAIVALTQSPAISPGFGKDREFAAIAAAVLGGTSLFGGKGNILPGTVLGAVLIQTVENGLNILNVDPYLYPLVMSGIIFIAVVVDTTQQRIVLRMSRRQILPMN